MGRRVRQVMRLTVQSCYTLRATMYRRPAKGPKRRQRRRRPAGTAYRGGRCPPSAIIGPVEPNVILLAAAAVGLALAAALLWRLRGRRRRHQTTRAGLRQPALEESDALMALIREREAAKPADPDAASLDPDEYLRRA